jgi:eukaryotic-like serine/threonine-protein kinase
VSGSQVIAFRVPVHYKVLRLFFQRLLTYWILKSQSLEIALTNTRAELNNYDRDCPGTSISPILLTSAYAPALNFPQQTRSGWDKRVLHILIFQTLLTKKFRGQKVKISSIAFIGLATVMLVSILMSCQQQLVASCNSIQGDSISCGEEIFLTGDRGIRQDKQAGADEIANGRFAQAIPLLTRAWAAEKDPETLIMLENAKLRLQNRLIKSIALTIPASGTPGDIPRAMLKAVASAQQQWNANSNHAWQLQIVLVNDGNEKSNARKLAKKVLTRDIFAGIGSYSSEMTKVVKDIYQQQHTVLVSSTSTSTELTSRDPDNFFFRVCSNNNISGKEIAKYLKDHKYTKIALFRTLDKSFSKSMTAALKENIKGIIDIVEEFDFEVGTAANNLAQAKQAGAQAIVLIPDAYTSDAPERNRLLSIIETNNGALPIIGNEVVKDQTLFNRFNKQQLQNLTISLPWHPSSYQNNTIKLPNFWGEKAQLDHRIAMTYDAAQVVITALDRLPIDRTAIEGRAEIQQIINTATFGIDGITGEINFVGSDRSQSINSLVQPKCDATKCAGFQPAR